MVIRKFRKDDIDGIAKIIDDTELWKRYGLDYEKAKRRFNKGLSENANIFVADIDGEITGFIWFVPKGAFDRSGYIELIGVKSDFRGQGIGRKLLEFVENHFPSVNEVFLLVSDFNLEAQRFYSNLGYKKVGEIKDYVVKGITEFIFYKKVR